MVPKQLRYYFVAGAVLCVILFALTYSWDNIKVYGASLGIAWVVSWIVFGIVSYVLVKGFTSSPTLLHLQ